MTNHRETPKNLVVDLGGTKVRVALADDLLRLSQRIDERTFLVDGAEGAVDQIRRMGTHVLARGGGARRLIISSPGPLNPRTGMVFKPPNMPGWGDVPLQAMLEKALDLPTTLVNDANAAALGEFHAGTGVDYRNLVYLTISTGIGGGVVIEGKLLQGTSGAGAEIGHITIDRHGPLCNCGNIGCLEMLGSGTSIARRFAEALAAGATSAVANWVGDTPATAADVARGMTLGDPLSTAVFTDAAEAIGFGVVSCIHMFNPEIVALGGGVTQTSALFDIVNRVVDRHTMAVPRADVKILRAALGDDVGLIGAAAVGRADP